MITVLYDGNVTSPDAMVTALKNGGYTVQQVIDLNPNLPPVAHAGTDFSVNEEETAQLDGSRSSDPDNDPLTYNWKQITGIAVSLNNANQSLANFTAPNISTNAESIQLVFELTVSDPMGESSTDRVTVTVNRVVPPLPEHTPITANQLMSMIASGEILIILDIRDRELYCQGYIPGAINYPHSTGEFEEKYANLPAAQKIVIVSQDGIASHQAALFLDEQRYTAVYDFIGGMNVWTGETEVCEEHKKHPPTAIIASVQPVYEGQTIVLDGKSSFDPKGLHFTYDWTATPEISLSATDLPVVYGVAPRVPSTGAAYTFSLTVTNTDALQHTDSVEVSVMDSGIEGFPEDTLPFRSAAETAMGIRSEGGILLKLDTVDSLTIPLSEDRPESIPHGLIDLEIKTDTPGAETHITIYFSEPAETNYLWYSYQPDKGWSELTPAVFNEQRDKITLTLTDGGYGDDDGLVNGVIRNLSGLALMKTQPIEPEPEYSGGGGSSSCFIDSLNLFRKKP